MPWTLYRSSDPNAPVLTGAVGGLTNVLRKCLVEGYSSGLTAKIAAGWVEPFTGTNKAVFRPGAAASSRQFYRVGHAAEDGDASICRIQGFDAMSSVDAGTGPFPLSAPCYPRVSDTSSGTARDWLVAADDRTCILFVRNGYGSNGSRWQPTYFGECFSFVPGDTFSGIVVGAWDGSGARCAIGLKKGNTGWNNVGVGNSAIARNYNGAPGATPIGFSPFQPMMRPQSSQYGVATKGRGGITNPADGKAWLGEILILSATTERCVRGRLRGLTHAIVAVDGYADGDTITDDTGKAHIYLRTRTQDWSDSGTEFTSHLFLETTPPGHN